MTRTSSRLALALLLAVASCGGKSDTDGGVEAGTAVSYSCYLSGMMLCYEYPSPTATQQANAPVVCSSGSGTPASPAACPTVGFLGKCTVPPMAGGMDGVEIRRFYTGADATYQQSFCTDTIHGTWSTTF